MKKAHIATLALIGTTLVCLTASTVATKAIEASIETGIIIGERLSDE